MSTSNYKSDTQANNPPNGLVWPHNLTDDDFVMLIEHLKAGKSPHLAERLGEIAARIAQLQQPEPVAVPIRA